MHHVARWLADLCALGLTKYEAKAYLALLHRRGSTAGEIARKSAVPRQRIYDVLGTLIERGLVRSRSGPTLQYAAIDPALAMERLIAEHRSAMGELEQTTRRLVGDLSPAWFSGQQEGEPGDRFELIREPGVAVERLAGLLASARDQVLWLAPAPSLVQLDRVCLEAAVRVHRRGGDVRCVRSAGRIDAVGPAGDHDWPAEVDRRVPEAQAVRQIDEEPAEMYLIDTVSAMVSTPDPGAGAPSYTSVLVRDPAVVQLLAHAFEAIWARAKPR